MFFVRLIGVVALVALNGFFAAAEFSLVAVRISRVRQLVARGSASARIVEELLRDLHRVVSGVQLGITLTSLSLGALGEATLANFFRSVWPGTPGTRSALLAQIQQARERGLLAPGEEKFILSAIELGQVQVREIMVSRPDMHVLPIEAQVDQVMRVFATTQRSRIPVYRGTIDHMLGFVHIKDMMWVLLDRERRMQEGAAPALFDLRRVLREI